MTVLTGQDLKIDALEILGGMYAEIEISYYQTGQHRPGDLEAARAEIGRLNKTISSNDVAANPRHTKNNELAAELVHFSYRYPEEFAEIFSESEMNWDRDINIRTAHGLFALASFLRSICDDHSYCLDPASEIPRLKADWQFKHHVPLVNPNELLEALQGYRRRLGTTHSPAL